MCKHTHQTNLNKLKNNNNEINPCPPTFQRRIWIRPNPTRSTINQYIFLSKLNVAEEGVFWFRFQECFFFLDEPRRGETFFKTSHAGKTWGGAAHTPTALGWSMHTSEELQGRHLGERTQERLAGPEWFSDNLYSRSDSLVRTFLFFFCFDTWDRVAFCSSSHPGIHVAEAGFKSEIFPLPPPRTILSFLMRDKSVFVIRDTRDISREGRRRSKHHHWERWRQGKSL